MERTVPGWSIALGLILVSALVVGFVPRGAPSFGGPFTMVDQRGVTVTDVSLRGAPFVVFFGFTRCRTTCPLTMTRLTRLRRALGPAGDALRVLFVSVDPDDTPVDVARFLDAFPMPNIGLTGTTAERERMMTAYRTFASGRGAGISHPGTLFLVGASGEPRAIVEPQDSDEAALAKLARLIEPPSR